MKQDKKLSVSKSSGKHFSLKAKPVSRKVLEQLKEASVIANEKIANNNYVYFNSNSHSSNYIINNKNMSSRLKENAKK